MVVLGQTPAGIIEPVPNLKKRQTHRYWRQINGEWVQTHPLPSDAVNKDLYLSKGFRLYPPGEDPIEKEREVLYAEIAELRKEREDLREKKAAKAA